MTKYEEIRSYTLEQMARFIFDLIKETVMEGPPFSTLDPELGTLVVKQALMTSTEGDKKNDR